MDVLLSAEADKQNKALVGNLSGRLGRAKEQQIEAFRQAGVPFKPEADGRVESESDLLFGLVAKMQGLGSPAL